MEKLFISPLGAKYEVRESYQGRYLKVLIAREYEDPKENEYCEKYNEIIKNHKDKVYVKGELIFDTNKGTTMNCKSTYMILENKDWKEYETVKEYQGEQIQNTKYKMKIEMILIDDEYSRRLFFDYKGEGRFKTNLSDIVEDLDNIFDELKENKEDNYIKESDYDDEHISMEFYSDLGDYVYIEMDEKEFKSKIASIRVVEYEEEIID